MFLSTDFFEIRNSKLFQNDYVLPDFTSVQRGYVKTSESDSQTAVDEQCLRINHERFTIPEILFHPSDVGLDEMGLAEATSYAILEKCPESKFSSEFFPEISVLEILRFLVLHPHLTKNIVMTGGCTKFDGFQPRLESDIRSLIPEDYDVRVFCPDE